MGVVEDNAHGRLGGRRLPRLLDGGMPGKHIVRLAMRQRHGRRAWWKIPDFVVARTERFEKALPDRGFLKNNSACDKALT
jgi:hypothetical protein